MDPALAPSQSATGVLEVLAGIPLEEAAARAGLHPADLADAIEVYQAAGHAALHAHAATGDWFQVRIQFNDWYTAEHTAATRLAPHLQHVGDTGRLAAWWYIRKAPCWRLRIRPGPTTTDTRAVVSSILDDLTAADLIDQWWPTIYEPEAFAFGGTRGMDIAHDFFHTDSRGILDYLRRADTIAPPEDTLGRRELSVLLCSALFREAGQDWYEQGDIWHRVTQLRPLPPGTPTDRLPDLAEGLRRLMTTDVTPLLAAEGPLTFAARWAGGFTKAGRDLADAAHHGSLQRGVRDILAHHVIFHWNRIGLPDRTQAILARVARDTVMYLRPPAPHPTQDR